MQCGCASSLTVRELLAAAQQERKVKLDVGRVNTVFKVGGQVLLRTKELLDAADISKLRPQTTSRLRSRPAQALSRAGRSPSGSWPGVR